MILSSGCTLIFPPPPATPPPPEQENQSPAIHSVTADEEVTPSSSSLILCAATDADGDALTYWWSGDSGAISGEGNEVTWTAPEVAGSYIVKVMVTDGRGGEATDTITITVTSEPNNPPVVTGFNVTPPNKPPVTVGLAGDRIKVSRYRTARVRCIVEDQDGDELNYIWSATGGKVDGEGADVQWIAPSQAANHVVTVIVSDGKGGEAEASVNFEVLCCGH